MATERLSMRKIREILRHKWALGRSHRDVAASLGVSVGAISVADPAKHPEWNGTNRRLILAKWMISPDNPLVPRVFVNRVWQWHFGEGIVRSVDDFGVRKGYARIHELSAPPTPKALQPLGEMYRPYRSAAAWYCWRAVDTVLPTA